MIDESKNQLVSIGLPTFNRAVTLTRAVDSLLAQKHQNFELIISDNASTDDTERICREYARTDGRIRYFRQEKNIGLVRQFGFLLSKARGDYFMQASDDDWWHPDFILRLKGVLDKHPEYGIAMSSLKQIHEDGSFMNEIIYDGSSDLLNFGYSRVFNAIVRKKPPAHFFIMGIFRMEVLRKLFWRPTEPVLGSDKIFVCEASLFTHFYSIPDVLWVRTSSLLPDAQRYTGDYKEIFTDNRAYLKHIRVAVSRLVRSPNIPLHRKMFMLPFKIPFLIWHYKKHLLRELSPSGFKLARKLLKGKK